MNLPREVWQQDSAEADLWISEAGLLVNTAALEARADYYEVVRVFVDRRELGVWPVQTADTRLLAPVTT